MNEIASVGLALNATFWIVAGVYIVQLNSRLAELNDKHSRIDDIFTSTKEYLKKVDFEQETIQDRITRVERRIEKGQ